MILTGIELTTIKFVQEGENHNYDAGIKDKTPQLTSCKGISLFFYFSIDMSLTLRCSSRTELYI
jgi:hypothetical protein